MPSFVQQTLARYRGRVGDRGRRDAACSRRVRARGNEGVSLVELTFAVALFAVLMAMVIPVMNTMFRTTTYVNSTNTNTNQLLPLSTNLQRLIRSAVQPAPFSSSGVPTAPFGVYVSGSLTTGTVSSSSLTFYSNIGDSNGPARITACFEASPPAYPTTYTQCASTPTTTFVITETKANAGSCPFSASSTATCTYTASNTRPLITLKGVVNGTTNPVFQYLVQQTTTTTTIGSGASTTTTSTVSNPSYSSCTANPTTSGSLGTTVVSSPLANCPAAEIQAVTVDLQVNNVGASGKAGGISEDSSMVYLLSTTSSNYSTAVG